MCLYQEAYEELRYVLYNVTIQIVIFKKLFIKTPLTLDEIKENVRVHVY